MIFGRKKKVQEESKECREAKVELERIQNTLLPDVIPEPLLKLRDLLAEAGTPGFIYTGNQDMDECVKYLGSLGENDIEIAIPVRKIVPRKISTYSHLFGRIIEVDNPEWRIGAGDHFDKNGQVIEGFSILLSVGAEEAGPVLNCFTEAGYLVDYTDRGSYAVVAFKEGCYKPRWRQRQLNGWIQVG